MFSKFTSFNALSQCLFVLKYVLFVVSTSLLFSVHAAEKAVVSIDPSLKLGPVNRFILGNNINIKVKKGPLELFFYRTGGGIWEPVSKSFNNEYITLFRKAGVSVLRWPGGPWPDSLNWTKLVGPVEKRPDNTFGLPEFLLLCKEINAQPLITLPTKVEQQGLIPDLIEYLNAPNNGSNPNGGIDWAKVRSNDGRDEPWGVVWFEFGNETFRTNISPKEYVSYYRSVYDKIKAIDNRILLGAVLEDTDNMLNGWNQTVISGLARKIGFVIIHPYYPVIKELQAKYFAKETVAKSTMSSGDLFISRLKKINQLIKSETGRDDLPIAVTEYNGNFVQNKPIRYRFTLFNAIHNADFVRIMLDPTYNIGFANHFHLVNSYWGMIRGLKDKQHKSLDKQANYYVYELYNRFLNDNLVKLNITSPTYSFTGAGVIPARQGLKKDGEWKEYSGQLPTDWKLRFFGEVDQKQDKGIVVARFPNKDVNYYHAAKIFKVKPDTLYRVSVKVKTTNITGGKVGIAVEDIRGWKKTFNQPANIQLSGTNDWSWVTVEIRTLPDAKKLRVFARHLKGKGPISGIAEFGEMRVEENESKLGETKTLVGVASSSADGSVLSLILLNKGINETVNLSFNIPDGFKVGEATLLSGPSPFASNFGEGYANPVTLKSLEYGSISGVLESVLPPSSMVGIRLVK